MLALRRTYRRAAALGAAMPLPACPPPAPARRLGPRSLKNREPTAALGPRRHLRRRRINRPYTAPARRSWPPLCNLVVAIFHLAAHVRRRSPTAYRTRPRTRISTAHGPEIAAVMRQCGGPGMCPMTFEDTLRYALDGLATWLRARAVMVAWISCAMRWARTWLGPLVAVGVPAISVNLVALARSRGAATRNWYGA